MALRVNETYVFNLLSSLDIGLVKQEKDLAHNGQMCRPLRPFYMHDYSHNGRDDNTQDSHKWWVVFDDGYITVAGNGELDQKE